MPNTTYLRHANPSQTRSHKRFSVRRWISTSLLGLLLLQVTPANGQAAPSHTPLNMNLTSPNATLHAPASIGTHTVNIQTGTTTMHVTNQSVLTPAERLAVWQVMSTGHQSLNLTNQGVALSGQLTVGTWLSQHVSDLVVPKGVNAIDTSANTVLSGNLTNYGVISVQAPGAAAASISAVNITNGVGATITSLLPLALSASGTLTNSGTINSAGSLTVSGATAIANALPAGVSGPSPVMNAASTINLITNTLTNSGSITAHTGDINLSAPLGGDIAVNNTAGQLVAQSGNININNAAFTGTSNFTLGGGNLLSNNVNIWAGSGTVDFYPNNVTGMLNIDAGEAHVLTAAPTLRLGTLNVEGDPTYVNNGNIVINHSVTSNSIPLAIIASQNITVATGGPYSITSGPHASADILLMAGAQFTAPGVTQSANTTGGGDQSSAVTTVTGGSSTGGSINLSTNPVTISSAATEGGPGGNITMVAFAGSASGSGIVNLGTGSINSGGKGASGGNVFIIAGATSGTGITTGSIDTSNQGNGIGGGAGQIALVTATPIISTPIQIANGSVSQGIITVGALQPASIAVSGNLLTPQSPITITAGQNVTLGGSITTGGTQFANTALLGNLSIFAGGNISTTGPSTINLAGSATGFAGGNVLMAAGAALQASGTVDIHHSNNPSLLNLVTNVSGGTTVGGNILLNQFVTNCNPCFSTAGATGGTAGGNVQLIAFGSSSSPSSVGTVTVSLPAGQSITTGGTPNNGTANPNPSGNVTILAGATTGTSNSITVSNIDTSGSDAGGGNITIATASPVASSFSYSLLPPSVNVPYGSVSTAGSILAGSTLSSSASLGSLNAAGGFKNLANSGAGSLQTATTSISVTTGSNLTTGSITNANNSLPANGIALSSSSIALTVGGQLAFSGASPTISSNATANTTLGSSGGAISVTAKTISLGTTNVTISADGTNGYSSSATAGGNGGTISITTTGNTSASNVNVGSTPNQTAGAGSFTISAQGDTAGGNGGSLTINSGANININSSNLTLDPHQNTNPVIGGSPSISNLGNGNGATITLNATTPSPSCTTGCLFVYGTLEANGAPSTLSPPSNTSPGGNGGTINITVNSSIGFNVGGATTGKYNGVEANGAGTGYITANGNSFTTGKTASFGNGGTISVTNLGTGGISVQATNTSNSYFTGPTANITVQAANAYDDTTNSVYYPAGSGGQIVLQAPSGSVFVAGPMDASGGGASNYQTSGAGGSIQIVTNSGGTSFTVGSSVTANGVNGTLSAVGNLTQSGATPTGNTGLTTLNPAGSGGSISISNSGTGGVTIGTGTVFGVSGPSISVAAGNANALYQVGGGAGGRINLTASAGPVIVKAPLNVNGGTGAEFSQTASNLSPGSNVQITLASTTGFYSLQTVGIIGSISSENPTIAFNGVTNSTITVIQLNNSYSTAKVVAYYGEGNGGNISITSASSSPFAVNSTSVPTNGVMGALTANGFSAGKISINNLVGGITVQTVGSSAGLNLVADGTNNFADNPPAGIFTSGGNGGTVTLTAPNGSIYINQSLNLNGTSQTTTGFGPSNAGNGGTAFIQSKSSTPFIIGAPQSATTPSMPATITTGITGSLTANGGSMLNGGSAGNAGSITVNNLGGGITVTNNNNTTVCPTCCNPCLAVTAFGSTNGSTQPGSGGSITLQAPNASSPVVINGSLSANGGVDSTNAYAPGLAGSILITDNSTTALTIGQTNPLSATGWNGGSITLINLAGSVSIDNSNANSPGLNVTPWTPLASYPLTHVYANQAIGAAGNGGNISLQALGSSAKVFINGSLNASGGGACTTCSNPPSISGFFSAGNGGQISIVSNSSTAFAIGSATVALGNGSTGALTTGYNITASGPCMNGCGLNGGAITVTNLGTGGVTLNAPSNLNVSGAPALSFSGANAGNGGNVYLNALGTNGQVYIGGSLSANGGAANGSNTAGNGGVIAVTANSGIFKLGSSVCATGCTNGVAGTLAATGAAGGSIGLKNLASGGGIQYDPASIVVTASTGNGGNIDLEAPAGNLTLVTGGGTLSANAGASPSAGGTATGGTVTLSAMQINPGSDLLTITALGDSGTSATGTGGTVIINQTTTSAVQLNVGNKSSSLQISVDGSRGAAGGNGGTISLTAGGAGIEIDGVLSSSFKSVPNTGTVNVTTTGTASIDSAGGGSPGQINAGNLNLSVGTGAVGMTGPNPLVVVASNLNVTSQGGAVYLFNNSTNSLTINNVSINTTSPTPAIQIQSNGSITVTGVISAPGPVSLTAGDATSPGNVTINGNIISSTSVTLTANDGSSTDAYISGTGLASAPAVTLLSGGYGITQTGGSTGSGNFNTAAGVLVLRVTGDTSGATSVLINNTGSLLLSTAGSSNLSALSVTDVGSLTTAGSINQATNITLSNSPANTSASITLGGILGAATAGSSVTINAGGSIVQTAAANVISANSVTLSSQNGNAGLLTRTFTNGIYTPGGTPLFVTLIANGITPGTLSVSTVNSTNNASPGTVNVSVTGNTTLGNITAGGDVLISTNLSGGGALTVPSTAAVSSQYGAITLLNSSTSNGAISVNGNVTASGGPVVIQNNNTGTPTNSINVGNSVTLSGVAWTYVDGNSTTAQAANSTTAVALITGAFPASPVTGTNPGGITTSGTGTVYFGASGSLSSTSTTVNANGSNVAFQGGTGAISLGSGDTINANGTQLAITSLDLSNTKLISALGSLGANSGVTVSGTTITFNPSAATTTPFSLSNLTAMNITGSYVTNFMGFSASNPIAVNVPTGKANPTVGGTAAFTSSSAQLFFNSNTVGNVFSIAPGSGSPALTSDYNLTLNAGGSVLLQGRLAAGTTGTLTLNVGSADPSMTSFTASSLPAGTLTFLGAHHLLGGTIAVNANNFASPGTATIAGNSATFTLGGYNFVLSGAKPLQIASSSLSTTSAYITEPSLTINAGSGATVNLSNITGNTVGGLAVNVLASPVTFIQSAAFQVSGTTLGNLTVQSTSMTVSGITTSANVSCGTCLFQAASLTNYNTIASTLPQGTLTLQSVGTALSIAAYNGSQNGAFNAGSGLTVNSAMALTVSGGAFSTTTGTLTLKAAGVMSLAGAAFNAGTSTNGATTPGGYLSGAGQIMVPTNIVTSGTITASTTGSLSTDSGVTFRTVGGNVTLSSGTAGLNLQGSFEADGGQIAMLSTGPISGYSPTFISNAVGTVSTNSIGGAILLSSTTGTPPNILTAFQSAPGTLPGPSATLQPGGSLQPLGGSVNISNNAPGYPTGVVMQQLTSTGVVNLSTSGLVPANLTLQGGAMLFNSSSSTNAIKIDGGNYSASAYTPIAYRSAVVPPVVFEQDEDAAISGSEDSDSHIANIFVRGHAGSLSATGHLAISQAEARVASDKQSHATVKLSFGGMLMNPVCDTTVRTPFGEVRAKAGALVSMDLEDCGLRVVALSGPGHVTVTAGGKVFSLPPGQEVVISDHQLSVNEQTKADGVGRRRFNHCALVSGMHASFCDVSLVSLLSNGDHFARIRQPGTALERKLAGRLMKSAAAQQIVTQGRGLYQALPKTSPKENMSDDLTPVRYLH